MLIKNIIISLILSLFLDGQGNRGYIVEIGDMAPNFTLKTSENKYFSLEDYRGKIIMLQFTASWCSVCLKEMPFIEDEIWNKHKKNDDFILLALAKDTDKRRQGMNEIEFMRNKTGATYPIESDWNSEIFHLFAQKKAGVTRNININKDGEIAFLTRLFDKDEFNEMKKIIEDLLAK